MYNKYFNAYAKTYLKVFIIIVSCFLSCCSFQPTPTLKQSPTPIHSFDYWAVLTNKDQIYVTSFPLKGSTTSKNRSLHYFIIVYDKNNNNYIISIIGGKTYSPLSEVIIKVNYNEYYLPISKDRAWLTNSEYVQHLINDMLESNELIVINTFDDNTQAIDTYGLKGLKQAINKIEDFKK